MRPLLPLLLLAACTPTRAVRPLPKGAVDVAASIGGPLTSDLGATIPVPLTNVGVIVGVDGLTNVHGTIHPTLLAVRGFGGSIGASRQLWAQRGPSPRLMADITLSGFGADAVPGGEPGAFRGFADVSGVLSWDLGPHAVYTGVGLFVQPAARTTAHLNPMVGTLLQPGRVGVALEAEWLAPYAPNATTATNWGGIGGRGALQLTAGLRLALGNR
jgi:hypothetical protein